MGSRSGRYYCGIYPARPHDCRDFTPIGCDDVDETLPRTSDASKSARPSSPNAAAAAATAGGRANALM